MLTKIVMLGLTVCSKSVATRLLLVIFTVTKNKNGVLIDIHFLPAFET